MNYYRSSKTLKASKKGKRKQLFQVVIESQKFDWNNPSREKGSMESGETEPKTICKITIESIKIIFVSLVILTLTVLTYLGLFGQLSKLTIAAPNVTISSEGPAAEMYPESMGQYKILKDIYRNNRAVYKHVDREDRFIIFNSEPGDTRAYITEDLKKERGFIRSIRRFELILPEIGWQYIKKCKAIG